MARQWNTWWFWPLAVFGGIPWAGGALQYFHNHAAREGYEAALADIAVGAVDYSGRPKRQNLPNV
jgi:hypothetical protein